MQSLIMPRLWFVGIRFVNFFNQNFEYWPHLIVDVLPWLPIGLFHGPSYPNFSRLVPTPFGLGDLEHLKHCSLWDRVLEMLDEV
jgi:hypothetical protein